MAFTVVRRLFKTQTSDCSYWAGGGGEHSLYFLSRSKANHRWKDAGGTGGLPRGAGIFVSVIMEIVEMTRGL